MSNKLQKFTGLLLFFVVLLTACRQPLSRKEIRLKRKVVSTVKSYIGVPYKLGGNDYRGIDCSGLVCSVFSNYNVKLPRQAWQQASFFPEISLDKVHVGDLLFFVTSGSTINHVGIVSDTKSPKETLFIHASTSKGVREDNVYSSYWKSRFVKATHSQIK